VSIWAGFATSGAILGLLGCGLILEWSSWRATFVATAVLAAVAFVAALLLAPNTSDPDEAVIDPPGYVLSGLGVGALVYGIVHGAETGWTTPGAVSALGVALAALAAFVGWELHTPRPMLDVRLFALRGFSTGTVGLTVQFLCLFGFFLIGMQFLQLTLGYSALQSALGIVPMAAIVMPMSRVAPHLVDRFGQRAIMTTGLVFLASGLVVMSQLGPDSTYWHFLGGLAIFGFGMALTSTPSTTAIVTSLPTAKQGVASAINDVSRELGSALGIALLGSLFNSGYREAIGDATATLPPESAHAVGESAGTGLAVASHLGAGGEHLANVVQDAFAAGLSDAMLAGAVLATIAAGFTAWRGPQHSRRVALDHAPIPTGARGEFLLEPVG
jgi:MFS family permease